MKHRTLIFAAGAILALTAPASSGALGGLPGDVAGSSAQSRSRASGQAATQFVVPDLLHGQRVVTIQRPRSTADYELAGQIDDRTRSKAAANAWRWFLLGPWLFS
jgi:hypothetical protein